MESGRLFREHASPFLSPRSTCRRAVLLHGFRQDASCPREWPARSCCMGEEAHSASPVSANAAAARNMQPWACLCAWNGRPSHARADGFLRCEGLNLVGELHRHRAPTRQSPRSSASLQARPLRAPPWGNDGPPLWHGHGHDRRTCGPQASSAASSNSSPPSMRAAGGPWQQPRSFPVRLFASCVPPLPPPRRMCVDLIGAPRLFCSLVCASTFKAAAPSWNGFLSLTPTSACYHYFTPLHPTGTFLLDLSYFWTFADTLEGRDSR